MLPGMHRAIRFYTDEPLFFQQRKNGLAWAGDYELGHKGEAVAHDQSRRFQMGLGFVVRMAHTYNQTERLLGS